MPVGPTALGHLPEAQVGLPVEAGVGLVEQQQLRLVQQRQREVELLPGAARQLLDPVAEVLARSRSSSSSPSRDAAARLLVEPVGLGEQLEVLGDGQLLPQQRLLRAVAQPTGTRDTCRRRGRAGRR